jgi:hypothetical protein
MSADEPGGDGLGDVLRSIAREVGESIERLAGGVDVDDFAGSVGVDPDRAREWVESTANWLGTQLEHLGDEIAFRAERPSGPRGPGRPAPDQDPLRGAAPHPLDLPTEEQGLALAALESGRWTIEPGSHRLVGDADSAPPGDVLGLVHELHGRDWITADGRLTLAGRRALGRWLDAASH